MAKSTKHKKLGSSRVTLILTAVVMVILSVMTIGFARYNKILDVNGNVALSPQGEIYISNVVFTGGKNVTSNPTFTNNSTQLRKKITQPLSSLPDGIQDLTL